MVAPKFRDAFYFCALAAFLAVFVFLNALSAFAQDDAAAKPAAQSAHAKTTSRRTKQTATAASSTSSHRSRHSAQTSPASHKKPDKHGHREAAAAAELQPTKHGRHHRRTATASQPEAKERPVKVITDKHGKRHQVVEAVTVDRHGRKHKHYQEVAQETVVRDRRGHVIRRFFKEIAGRHLPLQSEESTTNPGKEEEEAVPKESEELPHEYGSYGKAYALYDEGINARLSGNYKGAIASLSKALDMVPSNAHGGPSLLALNMEYELGQAAEASGDYALSARYYARAVADRPNFTEAFVHLATVLARNGQPIDALRAARAAVEHNPNDPRAHTILSIMLARNGLKADAQSEKMRAQSLLGSNTHLGPVPTEAPPQIPEQRENTSVDQAPGESSNSSQSTVQPNPGGRALDGGAPENSSSPASAPTPGASPQN